MTAARIQEIEPRFAAVYAEHVDYVWTNLRRLGVRRHELDDAVQETFLVAFRRWDDMRPASSWRPWLFGIARRVASHHRRGSGRRLRLVEAVAQEPAVVRDADDDVALRDAARLVHHFLQTLSPRMREVFVLVELEGNTGVEAADILGIKANTVWSRLRTARASFERYLGTLRARERGTALLRLARDERPPEPMRHRVMTALAVHIGNATTTLAGGWTSLAFPTLLSLGLGLTMLGTVALTATTLRSPAVVGEGTQPSGAATGGAPSEEFVAPDVEPPPDLRFPVTLNAVAPSERASPPDTPSPKRLRKRRRVQSGEQQRDAVAFRAELELLQRLRSAAKARRFQEVVRLGREHSKRFAGGELVVEREVLRIAALCGLGKRERANKRAAALRKNHGPNVVPAKALAECEEKPTTSKPAGQEQ